VIAARHGARALLGIALLGSASAALAGTWIDKYGRVTTLQAPGLSEAVLTPAARSAGDAAAAFKALCLDTGLNRTTAGKAAEAMGFRYVAATMPFKDPVDVGSWVAADAELTVGRDMFFAKEPQCNLVVAFPANVDRASAIATLSALIGPPANAAKATKKDGTADKRWQPEWLAPGAAAGMERRVFFHQSQPGRTHFAVLERKGAK
jgi:hypothetical protein